MKIAFVEYSNFHSFPIGGQLTFIRNYIRNAPDDEITIIGLGDNRHLSKNHINLEGNSVTFINVLPEKFAHYLRFFPDRLVFFLTVSLLKDFIHFESFDIIIVHSPELLIALKKFSDKLVWRMAGANNPLSASRFKIFRCHFFQQLYHSFVLSHAFSIPKHIVSINQDCTKLCMMMGRTPIDINLSVDTFLFKKQHDLSKQDVLGIPNTSTVVAYIGRISVTKRIDILLHAFALFHHTHPTTFMVIAGTGEHEHKIKNLAKTLSLEKFVLFLGQLTSMQVVNLLSVTDVFWMASEREGLPNSLLEAMACGVPVISSKVGGVPNLITHNFNGLLASSDDPSEYADLLMQALSTNSYLSANAIQTIQNHYSFDKLVVNLSNRFSGTSDRPDSFGPVET